MRSGTCTVLLFTGATLALAGASAGQRLQPQPTAGTGVLDEHPAIQYAIRSTRDRVSDLNRAITQGSVSLRFDPHTGFLRSLLDALSITAESQLLVFSKTGVQRNVTAPRTPRSLFFNESVVVGYIPGARFLELAAHDPEQGVVFYTIEQTAASQPVALRRTDCIRCHVSASTLEVPGMIARSNVMNATGGVLPMLGSHVVNHRTPLTQRWGGWYVTGNYVTHPYGGVGHMGNVTVNADAGAPVATSNEVFIDWLNSTPERRGYLSAESDIASLMVFDHQMHAINLLTRLHWEARVAASDGRLDLAAGQLRELVSELADYLLFVGEVPPPSKLTPRRGFAEHFMAGAPRDRQGRSLRELDLENRLLRYPCSYMVYTAAFNSLPAPAKEAVYRRMFAILSGADTSAKYSHLSTTDRRAIVEILRDTKTDLTVPEPASFSGS